MGLYLICGALLAALVASIALALWPRRPEAPTQSAAIERLLTVSRGWYAATAVLLVVVTLALLFYVAQPGHFGPL